MRNFFGTRNPKRIGFKIVIGIPTSITNLRCFGEIGVTSKMIKINGNRVLDPSILKDHIFNFNFYLFDLVTHDEDVCLNALTNGQRLNVRQTLGLVRRAPIEEVRKDSCI